MRSKMAVGIAAVVAVVVVFWMLTRDARTSDVPQKDPMVAARSPSTEADVQPAEVGGDLQPAVGTLGVSADAATSEAECSLEPAFPNVSDLQVRSCSRAFDISRRFAEEQRDSVWASGMEARILELLAEAEGLQVTRTEMDCRTTACGVLLVYPEPFDYVAQREAVSKLADLLRETLGFKNFGVSTSLTEDGITVATIGLMRADGREQFSAATPRVSALPSSTGLEIPLTGFPEFDDRHPARLLAAETKDPAWAQPMESRAMAEAAAMTAGNLVRLEAECRSTACGIAWLYSPNSELETDGIEDRLAASLGFERGQLELFRRQTGTIVAVYLQNANSSGQ